MNDDADPFHANSAAFTRSGPYRKNDTAHIGQKNYTLVRQWFDCERYDEPGVWPLIPTLCQGELNRLLNYFLPTLKLKSKERVGSRVVRKCGLALTPLVRVLACAEMTAPTKARLEREKEDLNPLALRHALHQ